MNFEQHLSNIQPWCANNPDEKRSDYRLKCFAVNLNSSDYAPRCYIDHQPKESIKSGGDPLNAPLDWPHILGVIYQIRCNLFHGGKSFVNSKDKDFARYAFIILNKVWTKEIAVAGHDTTELCH
jgi:hypothetical protein